MYHVFKNLSLVFLILYLYYIVIKPTEACPCNESQGDASAKVWPGCFQFSSFAGICDQREGRNHNRDASFWYCAGNKGDQQGRNLVSFGTLALALAYFNFRFLIIAVW